MKRLVYRSERLMGIDRLTISMVRFVICVYLLLFAGLNAMAMDPEGCFTCHQYPGLVSYGPNHSLRILHIDERRYLDSVHGKFECRKCHATIEKIPHTDDLRVDCTTECHQSDSDKQRIFKAPLSGFHIKEQSAITALEDGSSCRVCHPLYPHSANIKVRAFLNLHTGFMVCEVCHLNRQRFPDSFYDWNGAEVATFKGKPYGTFYNPKLNQVEKKSEHFISRISVFEKKNGKKKRLMNTWDSDKAQAYLRIEKTLTAESIKNRLGYFHRDIDRKEISVACDECHSHHSILDFKQLGFNKAMTNNLIQLNIKGLVTKYKVFYFPHLLDQ